MDHTVLARVTGSIVVLAGAARPGSDYAGASARTVAHYGRLGAVVEVAPDPRDRHASTIAALHDDVGLVVLPGGSPGGLLDALTMRGPVGGPSVAQRLIELWEGGTAVSGASAGAMVLCARTATPDRSTAVSGGLGLVDGMAIPHWSPGSERRWSLPDTLLWGLPECGGVIIDGDTTIAVGQGDASIRVDGTWSTLPR